MSGVNFTRHAQAQTIGKTNKIKVLGRGLEIKGSKQDSHDRLRSHMPHGGKP